MKTTALPLIVLLVSVSLLSSCGFKDIDKRFFVVATAIDSSGNEKKPYRITLQLAAPSPKIEPGASKTVIQTIDSQSIAEGVRLLKAHVDKELDFGHCKLFLIGEQLAYSQYQDVLHWMSRRRDFQSVSNVAIGKPDALTVLKVKPLSQQSPGNTLYLSFSSNGTESPFTYSESLFDFARRSMEKGLDPLLPVIMKNSNESFVIDQIALLNKKSIKLVLSASESQIYNQLAENFVKSSVYVEYEGVPLVAFATAIRTKYKITNQNNKPLITMNVKMNVIFEEAPKGLFDKQWSKIEEQLNSDYEKSSEALLQKIQKANVDPFGFGLRYRATHPGNSAWEEWQSIYPNVKFDVRANINIEGTGIIK